MNINFEYKDVAASTRLEAMVTEKLNKLEGKYDFIVGVDVYFKKQNMKGEDLGKICEIRANVPGATLFAETANGSFEAAIAKTVSELKTQLQKKKEKMQTY
ncbi:ribosome hibernation-promoting factor, HPF/YfiA family [Cochleicola gelatinilyticus]|uniref:30S ribosomal protein S30 n=1 Tax=Cochleicola gelatinilyticus TaxID=1763537 RepID=A0A167GWK9_9FLAO|nr:ribosome-associated translation inhibitor RaiA [Cochleicola gelatinilyticus]OAB77979.1 30S ribosomal protein S30 [Cochleicola gelatinilyticus]